TRRSSDLVLRNGVAAPGTAAESRGRGKAIGQRTAGSKGRRLVDDQPADGKFQAGSTNIGFIVGMNGSGMPGAFQDEIGLRFRNGFFKRLAGQDGESR